MNYVEIYCWDALKGFLKVVFSFWLLRYHYSTSYYFSFVSKYNSSLAKGAHSFQTHYNDKLLLFIKNFLLPNRAIMGYRVSSKKKLIIFLNPLCEVKFFIRLTKKTHVFSSVRSKYLSHINRSSLNVVRDFYFLLTPLGLITLEESLLKKTGGVIVFQLSFFSE